MRADDKLLRSALWYAQKGFPVFPCTIDKKPLLKDGGGFHGATRDKKTIRRWWETHPSASIGIPTGRETFDVLDVDPRHGGDVSLELIQNGGPVTTGPVVQTGGGGLHYFFEHCPDIPNSKGFRPGLDWQGQGAYIIAPPSGHPSGSAYTFIDDAFLGTTPLPTVPTWLRESAGATERKQRKKTEDLLLGERNNQIFKAAAALRRDGLEDGPLLDALMAINKERCKPPLGTEEVQVIAGSACRYEKGPNTSTQSGSFPIITTASSIEPREVSWLWHGWLPRGKLCLLDGDADLGKTFVALHLVAEISRGRPMPDGSLGIPPADALFMSAEDDADDTIIPRLIAMDADLDRVHIVTGVGNREGKTRMIQMPGDFDAIRQAVEQTGAAFVVIDPFFAYVGGQTDTHKDAPSRSVMSPLKQLAEETDTTFLLIRHYTKGGDSKAIHKGGGSVAFLAAARSALMVAKDPDDDTRRVFAVAKCNLAATPPALLFRFVPSENVPKMVRLEWLGTSTRTADEILAAHAEDKEERGALQEAKAFLEDSLDTGVVQANKIYRQAESNGIARRTLQRAKRELKVKSDQVGTEGWFWSLPSSPQDEK